MQIYVVTPGDTIDRIAGFYGVSVEEISYANQIPYPFSLAVGEALLIPVEREGIERRDRKSVV